MFGNDMMEKLQQMQQQMAESKKKLAGIIMVETVGPVTVKVDGNGEVKDVTCEEEISQEELLDYIILATNKALDKAAKTKELEMAQSAKGILPGM